MDIETAPDAGRKNYFYKNRINKGTLCTAWLVCRTPATIPGIFRGSGARKVLGMLLAVAETNPPSGLELVQVMPVCVAQGILS